jgi:hypothetical protein
VLGNNVFEKHKQLGSSDSIFQSGFIARAQGTGKRRGKKRPSAPAAQGGAKSKNGSYCTKGEKDSWVFVDFHFVESASENIFSLGPVTISVRLKKKKKDALMLRHALAVVFIRPRRLTLPAPSAAAQRDLRHPSHDLTVCILDTLIFRACRQSCR